MAGITRTHGTAETGDSANLTGTKSSFFSGYQPLYVKIATPTAVYDFTTGAASVDSEFEQVIKACQAVGTVTAYGAPANAASSSTVIVAFDAASLNQGDGVAGSGVTTGFGALKGALVSAAGGSVVAGHFSVTSSNGFTGGGFTSFA